ncbi:MAG: FtsX-like permease family protein, partial [Deltaproteobacteria bacterium]|nr:FtsX-like permease family protein [Deltaproteobacteria bacterium]
PERQSRVRTLLESLGSLGTSGEVPVLLSQVLSERLGAVPETLLSLLRIPREGGGFSPEPLPLRLRVVGLFNTGIMAFDEMVVITHVNHLGGLFPDSKGSESLGVRLQDPMRALEVSAYVRANHPEEGRRYYIYSWLETNRGLFQVIVVQKAMLFLVLLLIVVIAFFGMISALVMLVVEKTKEISVLKALGMRDRSIYRLFLSQGLLIGLVGSLLGVLLGLGICWLLDTFPLFEIPPGVYPGSDRVPVKLSLRDLALVLGATWLTCLAATLFPARKATALRPVEGLRRG